MLFNSIAFGIFLPIVFIVYWLIPHKYRWFFLLLTSYYFYMSWNAKYIFLILFTTVVSYVAAIFIERAKTSIKKKIAIWGAVLICLSLLGFYKYFNFFSCSIVDFLNLFAIRLNPILIQVTLPVGISFYTFQTISYVVDVYRGKIKAEKHFGYYAAFISFFPQLVAGPIERTENLLPQIKTKKVFNYDQATYGLKLMAWGFFKKIAIADVLGVYVDTVYSSVENYKGFSLVLVVFFFAIQIYCDFSGYSDIAIGCAKLLGINLMTNFKSPYFSSSIKEFWSRWHISLSTWLRDYVYIPLGGNRVGIVRHKINLIITFLISGLWHGANWKYVIWGGIHGIAQVIESCAPKKNKRHHGGIMWVLHVFVVFIFCTFAWVFFRANNIGEVGYIISNMFVGISSPLKYMFYGCVDIGMGIPGLVRIIISLTLLFLFDFASLKLDVIDWIGKQKVVVRYISYVSIILLIVCFSYSGSAEFVYFQF